MKKALFCSLLLVSAVAMPLSASAADPVMLPAQASSAAALTAEPMTAASSLEPLGSAVLFTPWQMFLQADALVKSIMVGLLFLSLLTWTILLAKHLELSAIGRRKLIRLQVCAKAQDLSAAQHLYEQHQLTCPLLETAAREWQLSADRMSDPAGIKERVAIQLGRLTLAEGRQMKRSVGLLATIGSTAPFIGLLGTVWGVMNSFIGIAQAKSTSLSVVAPGIAEALFATALGLMAAIPAVIIYNFFSRKILELTALTGDQAALIETLVSRQLSHPEHGKGCTAS